MTADLFWPAFAQFALTFVIALVMGAMRSQAIQSGATKGLELRTGQQNWPGRVQQVSSCYANQFESPVLFFLALIFGGLLGVGDPLFVGLAWMFVAARVVHAAIYVTTNVILYRFLAFLVGLLAILAMWLWLAVRVAGVV